MNLSLFAQSTLFTTLQMFSRWLLSGKAPVVPRTTLVPGPARSAPAQPRKACTTALEKPHFLAPKPLRVVRVMEAGQARSSVGRMVISGRMADVCAELDRLAAREAALS